MPWLPSICRLYTRAFWGDRDFLLIDTGGLMSDAEKLPKEQQASDGTCVCVNTKTGQKCVGLRWLPLYSFIIIVLNALYAAKPVQEIARRSISAAGLPAAIERQAAAAVEEADVLVLVVDGQASSCKLKRTPALQMWLQCCLAGPVVCVCFPGPALTCPGLTCADLTGPALGLP